MHALGVSLFELCFARSKHGFSEALHSQQWRRALISQQDGRAAQLLSLPALMLPDGSIMTESAAILLHIADAHPEAGLAPPPGTPTRAQHDRWLIFLAVNVYEGELRKLYGERYTADDDGKGNIEAAARAYVDRHYVIVEEALGDGPYVFGDDLSVLDIYLWTFAHWHDPAWLGTNCPKIARLVHTVRMRPKITPIHKENFGA